MASPAATAPKDRIAAAFEAARADGRAALMPYMMGSFPDPEAAVRIAAAYADAGADLVELGVPFSDPLADGPVIHAAGTRALDAGADLDSTLEACDAIGGRVPVAVMCYSNMVLSAGAEAFASRIAAAGAAGAIVPDMPLEEAGETRAALDALGLAMVPLVAPTTPPERRRLICESASGFVYVVSDVGVTGERGTLPPSLAELIQATRTEAGVPVAVGFGIGTPEQVAEVGRHADGVIVGSRLVRAVIEADDPETAVAAVTDFISQARAALSEG